MITPDLLHLLDVLAEIEVRNYLHPQAASDNDSDAERPNHPATAPQREAA